MRSRTVHLIIAIGIICAGILSVLWGPLIQAVDEIQWSGILPHIYSGATGDEAINIAMTQSTVGLDISEATALTNTVHPIMDLTHTTSGTPAAGIGLEIEATQETSASNNEIIGSVGFVVDDATATSEDASFSVELMAAGAAKAEKFAVESTGVVTLVGGTTLDNATAAGRLDLTEDVIDQSGWRAMSIVTTTAQSYSLSSTGKAGLVIQTAGEAATMHFMTDLLTSPGAGGWWVVKTGDASDIVIDTEGAETIDGGATYTIDGTLEAVTFATDGTNFHVIGSYLE